MGLGGVWLRGIGRHLEREREREPKRRAEEESSDDEEEEEEEERGVFRRGRGGRLLCCRDFDSPLDRRDHDDRCF